MRIFFYWSSITERSDIGNIANICHQHLLQFSYETCKSPLNYRGRLHLIQKEGSTWAEYAVWSLALPPMLSHNDGHLKYFLCVHLKYFLCVVSCNQTDKNCKWVFFFFLYVWFEIVAFLTSKEGRGIPSLPYVCKSGMCTFKILQPLSLAWRKFPLSFCPSTFGCTVIPERGPWRC